MEQSIYPRNGGVWMAAQNDRGGGGGAAPTERVVEGWSPRNDGFNFCRHPPPSVAIFFIYYGIFCVAKTSPPALTRPRPAAPTN